MGKRRVRRHTGLDLTFTFDATPPNTTLDLAPASDSGVQGDRRTSQKIVTLVGQTEANTTVKLVQTGTTTTANATGAFEFTNVSLVIGDNLLTTQVTDLAGNSQSTNTTFHRVNPITIALTGSTIAENSAGGTIVGQLSSSNPDGATNFTYALVNDADGRFQLVGDQIQVANGAVLDFETYNTHEITVRSTSNDGQSVTQAFAIAVTNVNEIPRFVSTPILAAQEGTPYRYDIVTIDPDQGDTRHISADTLPAGVTLVDHGDGTATLQGNPTFGIHTINLTVEDTAGAKNTQSFTLSTSPNPLIEGDQFTATRSIAFIVPSVPSILRFKVDPQFDFADSQGINDAFEVALVDANGKSLLHTIAPDQQVCFNWSEGEPIALGAGASYDAANHTVSLNLAGLTPNTAATLIFRLVNNDNDTTSQVNITDLTVTPVPTGIQPPTQTSGNSSPSSRSTPDFTQLSDVTGSVRVEYHRTTYNTKNQVLYTDIVLHNIGGYSTDAPLLVAITQTSDPSVLVRNPDGFTPEGLPYYNFSHRVADGKFDPNDVTGQGSLAFYNPNQVQFSYKLIVLSQLNQGPAITTQPVTEVIEGDIYQYQIKATDPNQDTLTYSLQVAPDGMTVDAQTGIIRWETATQPIGNYSVQIQISDGRGGIAEQGFTLAVIETPPNRPPIFTTTPVVDAQLGQPYQYDANAIDPDSDPLTYRLVQAPSGMTIDPNTGVVQWIPPVGTILGDTVISELRVPGETDEFILSGTKGQTLYFDPLQYTGNSALWKIDVYNPSGAKVLSGDLQNNALLTLRETGDYRIVVSNAANATGAYGFSVIDTAVVPVVLFDQVITGSLAPGSEDDVFRFTGTKGQKLFFDKLNSSGGNLRWTLYDDKNQVVASLPYFDDMELYLPKSGEYRLALHGQSSINSVVNYTFEIITPEELTRPIELGDNTNSRAISGEIREKGERDFYTFTATAGQRIYFDRLFQNPTAAYSQVATILNPAGQKVFEYNLQYETDPSPIALSQTGTYTVIIDAAGENTGSYSFSLLDLSQAEAIDFDIDHTGTLNPGREAQLYQFNGVAGQHLYLDALVSSASGLWTLYDSGNQALASNALNADIEVVLDDTDTYTLVVQGYSDNLVGYGFRVITPKTQTATLNVNTPISATLLEKGEQDVYTFTGSRGQRIFLDTLLQTSQIIATLIAPTGTSVFNSVQLHQDYNRHPVILPGDGEYRLIIDGVGETTGDYHFQLVDLSNAPLLTLETPTTDTTDLGLQPGSEIDAYRIVGNKGDRLYFENLQSANGRWYLYSPGNVRLTNTALSTDFEYVLPGAGTYYLVLQGENSAPAGYQFQVIKTTAVDPIVFDLNTPQSGAIARLGEQDVYAFTAIKGQQVFFDALTGGNNLTVKIFNPSGNEVFSGTTTTDGTAFTLPESGTYRVVIDGQNSATGGYSFQIATAVLSSNPASFGSANSLLLNNQVTTTLNSGETKLYKFTGTMGQKLWLDGLNPNQSRVSAILYGPSNAVVSNLTDLSQDSGLLTLKFDGEYYLAIQNHNTRSAAATFRLLDAAAAPSLSPDTRTAGNFGSSYRETVLYRLDGNAGQHLYLDTAESYYGYYDAYNYFSMYGTDGRLIINGTVGGDVEATLPTNGEYIVALQGQGSVNSYAIGAITSDWLNTTTSIGETVAGSLTKAGQQNTYVFTGTANQLLYFDGLGSSSGIFARLYSPTNEQIFELGSSIDSDPFTLKETGTYRLVVDGTNNSTGTYRFRLLDTANAVSKELDTDVVGSFVQSLETHFYRFSGQQGQHVLFDPNVGEAGSRYTLYRATGEQLLTKPLVNSYGQVNKYDELALPYTGEYLLAVQAGSPSNTAYSLRTVTSDWNSESLQFGQTINAAIDKSGEQDVYTFTASAGQQIFFDGLQGNSNTHVELYTPSGRRITDSYQYSYEDGGIRLSINGGFAGYLPITLTDAGTYTMVVDSDWDITGNYSFRILDWSNAAVLTLDTTVTGDFGANLREAHLYRFTGEQGKHLFFNRDIGATFNFWQLFDASGNTIGNQHSLGSDFELNLPYSGEYTLLLRGNGYIPSNYQFEVVTSEFTTAPLMLGESIATDIHEAGEQDRYTFEGAEGQLLYLDSLLNSNSAIKVTLYSPSGEVVGLNQRGLFSEAVASNVIASPFALTETGKYTLVVDAEGEVTGNYSFRLLDIIKSASLPLDQSISINFGSSGRETQLYRISGTAGDYRFFRGSASGASDEWTLLDAQGNAVLLNTSGNKTSLANHFELALPQTEDYYLVVKGNNSGTSSHQIEVVTVDLSTDPLTLGNTVTSELQTAGEQDAYIFTGTIGQRLFFDALQGSSSFGTCLYDPTGNIVFNQGLFTDAIVTLTEPGTYRLVVDGTGASTGAYSFVLSDLSKVTELDLSTSTSNRFSTSNETHLYQFSGEKGTVLNFDLQSANYWTNGASWVLYNPNNQVLATSSSVFNSDFQVALSSTGLYALAIFSNGTPVDYSYSFRASDITPEQIVSSGLGVTQSGTITAGVVNEHTFSASAGTLVYLDSLVGSNAIRIDLLNPDGTKAVSSHLSFSDLAPFVLQQSGTYTLQVQGSGGIYQFRLLELSDDPQHPQYTPLELGKSIAGQLETGSSAQVFSFQGTVGQKLLFDGMQALVNDGYASIRTRLYDVNGKQLFSLFDLEGEVAPFTLTQDGTYHLVLSGATDIYRGYRFQLLDMKSGQDLPLMIPQKGVLPTGQESQLYQFTGKAGEQFLFDSLLGSDRQYWNLYRRDTLEYLGGNQLDRDFSVVLPSDGTYVLRINGAIGNQTNYQFRVINQSALADRSPDMITPGTGEQGSSNASFNGYTVKLAVEDGRGGISIQDFRIRLHPDPTNTAPTIVSTPETRVGLNSKGYRYQLETLDADGDELKYRLIESPSGAFINQDTGELIWFPPTATIGSTSRFTVEVTDGHGGTDRQSFGVEVFNKLGKIQGSVFEDLNNNGYRDTTVVQGENPDVVFVIDISGSTGIRSVDWTMMDLGTFAASPRSILEMEQATALILSEQLISQGRGDTRIGIVLFNEGAGFVDMNPSVSGLQLYTTAQSDNNHNGILDIREVLNFDSNGGTDFTPGLERA